MGQFSDGKAPVGGEDTVKKKLLFVMPTMHIGGSVRNFLSLVSLLDPERYDITLQLFRREGALLEQIPEHVHIVEFSPLFRDFQLSWWHSCKRLFLRHPITAGMRLIRLFAGWIPSFRKNVSQKEWYFLRRLLPMDPHKYDAAIGYLQTVSIYYTVEKVTAKIKIGFIRNEYTAGKYDPQYDDGYFAQLDYIGAVSQAGFADLQKVFPHHIEKIRLLPNVVSPDFCRQMAQREENPFAGQEGIHLVSVGRLVDVKGFDMAVEAVRILRSKGYPVIWHIIGIGPEKDRLERLALDAGMAAHIVFSGEKANPYPYMKAAEIYVQTSRSEGWCISLQEALILGKPVVTTDFPTAYEQVEHGRTGLIAAMNPEAVANAVKTLLDSPEMRTEMAENARAIQWDPYKALQTFFRILEE
jgi:glycosyltransferase involved in cell wall biosynthesis